MVFCGMRMKRVLLRTALFAGATMATAFGGYLAFLQIYGNFHTVIPGEFYRSAQPSSGQLADYVRRYGIRTVINLRGASDDAGWYRAEIAEAGRLGVQHIDFAMSSSSLVNNDTVDRLVAIMKTAPKPILIHCKAGADRSGFVAAVYGHDIAGWDQERAERQLSVLFGHIGIPYLSPAYAMDESWEKQEQRFRQ